MKLYGKSVVFAALFLITGACQCLADQLILDGDVKIDGTVLESKDYGVVFTTEFGTEVYQRDRIKSVYVDEKQRAERAKKARLPDLHAILAALEKKKWAVQRKQIPATVIDQGTLKNVPYTSYRIGKDYEINVYGDLDHPAGIEAGVYRELLTDGLAKDNCLDLIFDLLTQDADKAAVFRLKQTDGIVTNAGMTFEITPPTAKDAYGGWWISVYSEAELDRSRASDQEMATITVSKSSASTNDSAGWTADDLKFARSTSLYPSAISFVDESGHPMKDVRVVRVNEGVSVVWRDGASGGVLKLASLPEKLRQQFHYDAAKAAKAEEQEKLQKQKDADYVAAMQRAALAAASSSQDFSSDSGFIGVGGGSVYVRGYTRANGTYVAPYTRSSPHSH